MTSVVILKCCNKIMKNIKMKEIDIMIAAINSYGRFYYTSSM